MYTYHPLEELERVQESVRDLELDQAALELEQALLLEEVGQVFSLVPEVDLALV